MFVTIDGINYKYSFRHSHDHHGYFTECTIFREVADHGWEMESTGTANCHPTDHFCKEAGRKLSLRRALDSHWEFRYTSAAIDAVRRLKRQQVWNSYFARSPKTSSRVKAVAA